MLKYIFIITIKLYWLIIPKHKRRSCLFKVSCSNYVYQKLQQHGFYNGWMAFKKRYAQCRSNYKLYYTSSKGDIEIHLADGSIVDKKEIKIEIFKNYLD